MKRIGHFSQTARSRRRASGFTLIELLIAVAILAVVAVLSWRGLDQIILARETIMRQMAQQRIVTQVFGQLAIDLRQSATDDEAGAPVIDVGSGALRIVRHLRAPGEPPRLQVVRYRLTQAHRLVRSASPGLATVGQVRGALADDGSGDGWSSTALMDGIVGISASVYVPDQGFTNRMSDVMQAINRNNAALRSPVGGNAPLQRSVTGVDINVRVNGMRAPLHRIMLVGQ